MADTITFTAQIRADLAATMQKVVSPGDWSNYVPHIVGWRWIPDLNIDDPFTKACDTQKTTCRMMVGGPGTMVFVIRTKDQVCAGWVHLDARLLPEMGENNPRPRLRADSVNRTLSTKMPYFHPCTD